MHELTRVSHIGPAMRDPCAILLVSVFAASSTKALSTRLVSGHGASGQISAEAGSGTVNARARAPGPHQVYITARDGVQLHTVYTLPGPEDKKYTVVMDRSPYGEFGTGTHLQLASCQFNLHPGHILPASAFLTLGRAPITLSV